MKDFPDLPDFLRVTPEEQTRRREYWKTKRLAPTARMTFSTKRIDEDPTTRAFRREMERAEKEKTAARFAALKEAKAERKRLGIKTPTKPETEQAPMIKNNNCDGLRCLSESGEVRVYPLGGGGNLILCVACASHENAYRKQRGRETGRPENFPLVDWFNCEIYKEAGT